MMGIDIQIAHRLNLHVDQAMPGNLIQHVIQKRQSRFTFKHTTAIQIHSRLDLRFLGVALYGGLTARL